jgi:glycosyltransferase involved in cell wall biosynthesis
MPPALVRSADQADAPLSQEERALIPEQPFFLFPANLWPHKNHRRLLSALKRFNQSAPQRHALVLTGHPDGWEDLQEHADGEPVYHHGFVRRELLRELFQRARALTYFSLYEGFGMPLLEAFDAGLPVLCSNTSSLPEVGGDAVLTCDPTDVEAMAELMHQITQHGDLPQTMIRRGKERLDLFSWRRSAETLRTALETLHRQNAPPRSGAAGRPSRLFLRWWDRVSRASQKKIVKHYRTMHEQAGASIEN